MIELSRRGFFGGAVGLVAAPAIIRVAKLMPVRRVPMTGEMSLLYKNDMLREFTKLFKSANVFMERLGTLYDDSFAREEAKIGTSLRIRLRA